MNDHDELAIWAAQCAERVLHIFEAEQPDDPRPRQAVESARLWQRGELSVTDARKFAFAAHSAARQAMSTAAVAAARAAGHAAATAHVATHAPHAARYAREAVASAGEDANVELSWQTAQLPIHLRTRNT